MDNTEDQPSQPPSAAMNKLPPIPAGATVHRRPIPSGPSPSLFRIHVSTNSDVTSVVTRVQKRLNKHKHKSRKSQAASKQKLDEDGKFKQSRSAATGDLSLGPEDAAEVLVIGTGRAIKKVAMVALVYQKRRGFVVQLRTGSVAAIDDVILKDDDGLEGHATERARLTSSIEVSIKNRC